mmetsp:Transcript_22541/g.32389  ORF Transcript_22541/g.32389 Transcript_22541/m.32389 type:complete len:199 (-) Transcript_22541:96-692(-)
MKSPIYTNPYFISGTVSLSYLLFYTGYDKIRGTLVPNNVVDVFLCRRGVDWSLVELNKALALAALTNMLIGFLPTHIAQLDRKDQTTLVWISMNMLWIHTVYSMYKFYSFSPRKLMAEKFLKRFSVFFGALGNVALTVGFFEKISWEATIIAGTILGIAHFWSMEVDYKYVLQVRPYAYLPFPLAAIVLGFVAYKYVA